MTRAFALALLLTACTGAPPAPGEGPSDDKAEGSGADDKKDSADSMAFSELPSARVNFVKPQDGASVTSPVELEFGVDGATIKPAGELVAGTGHHHLIIDHDPTPIGVAVPADDTHIHYGKGQTQDTIELEPGEHRLSLQLADGMHRSYGPTAATTITITVTADDTDAPSAGE